MSAVARTLQGEPDLALTLCPLATDDSITDLDAATFRIGLLAQGLASLDSSGFVRDAIDAELTALSVRAQSEVLARVPRGETRNLAGSVRVLRLTGKRRGFKVTAGAFTKKGFNYGWFTELGTDAAAQHAVDKIGYVHTSSAPSKNPGIAAQHWFAEGWKEAMHDAPQAVSRAVRGALASLLTH